MSTKTLAGISAAAILAILTGQAFAEVTTSKVISVNLQSQRNNGAVVATEESDPLVGIVEVPASGWTNDGCSYANNLAYINDDVAVTLKQFDGSAEEEQVSDLPGTILHAKVENAYVSGGDSTDAIFRGYNDDTTPAVMTVKGIPYAKYDVIVYAATDSAGKKFGPVSVNGVPYKYDADLEKVVIASGFNSSEDTAWGESRVDAITEGKNAIRIPNQTSKVLTIRGGSKTDNVRGGIAAFQIVEVPQGEVGAVPEAAFTYDGAEDTTSGWFDTWAGGNENFSTNVRALGPNNELVCAADHIQNAAGYKWHPYKSFQAPATFSLSFYTDLSLVSNDSEKMSLIGAGGSSGNRATLTMQNGIVSFEANGGSISMVAPSCGYHLFTMTYKSAVPATEETDAIPGEISLTIDGNETITKAIEGLARPANGFQIGGVYGGGLGNPSALPVAKVLGFDTALTRAEIEALARQYPGSGAVQTANVTKSHNDIKMFVGTQNFVGSHIEINRGTLAVPAAVTLKTPSIGFGNVNADGTANLELNGKLLVTGASDKTAPEQGNDSIRSDVKASVGGFLGGEWTGSGTYNVRGTLDISKSYMQTVHSAAVQTYNIENGGKILVKGIQANKYSGTGSHVFNVKNGGLLKVTTPLSLGTVNANVAEGGTLELANLGNDGLLNSTISGLTINGKLKFTGTNYVKLPTGAEKLEKLASFAEINNELSGDNGQFLMTDTDKVYTIGSLSGNGGIRGDWSGSAPRTLKIVQHKNTTWNGGVRAGDGNSARLINIVVGSDNDSTLTMSGNSCGTNARPGTLTVEKGATVDLSNANSWPTTEGSLVVKGTLITHVELDPTPVDTTVAHEEESTVWTYTANGPQSWDDVEEVPAALAGADLDQFKTWVKGVGNVAITDADTTTFNASCFLLNIANDSSTEAIAEAKETFKITSFTIDADGTPHITTTTGFNGTIVIKRYSDVACTTESADGTFFKAVLGLATEE